MRNSKQNHELEAIEHFVDKAIPYLVVILGVMLVLNFTTDVHKFDPWFTYLDWSIIAFFVADLIFKWRHVRKVKKFVRLYWLEIIAVFPFYLIIRAYATIAELLVVGERVQEFQQFTHEALLVREAKVLRETELLAKESQLLSREVSSVGRFARFVQRLIRFIWASLHYTTEHLLHVSRKNRRNKIIFSK